jgi:hypothetical protein
MRNYGKNGILLRSEKSKEVQAMTSNLPHLDLETLRVAQDALVSALQSQSCEWEQESADAIASGHLSVALMKKEWAFAADLLSTLASKEFFVLRGSLAHAPGKFLRSNEDLVLDELAIEITSRQPVPIFPMSA